MTYFQNFTTKLRQIVKVKSEKLINQRVCGDVQLFTSMNIDPERSFGHCFSIWNIALDLPAVSVWLP